MEKCDLSCISCKSLFNIDLVPYVLPCQHIYCFECLKKTEIPNTKSILCPHDERMFEIEIEKVPVSRFYKNFKHLFCNTHVDRDIEFVHIEKKDLLCTLCVFKCGYLQNELKKYSQKDFLDDLKQIENYLEKISQEHNNKINEFRTNKSNNSKDVQKYFKKTSEVFKIPFANDNNSLSDKFENVNFNPFVRQFTNQNELNNSNDLFLDSIILKDHPNKEFMIDCFPEGKIKSLTKLYQGSKYNFNLRDLIKLCEKKGSTLTVFKSSNTGLVFGIYLTESYYNNSFYYLSKTAPNSFIFQLDFKTKHPLKNNNSPYVIHSIDNNFLKFGGGYYYSIIPKYYDLNISGECNSNKDSYSNLGNEFIPPPPSFFNLEEDQTKWDNNLKNLYQEKCHCHLAGTRNFSIQEMEVFNITW